MRRQRRTRIDASTQPRVLAVLINKSLEDHDIIQYISEGNRNKAFGKLLNKWLDSETKESVIDRYIDKDAYNITWYAINTIRANYL